MSERLDYPPRASGIPKDMIAGVTVTADHVRVSVRREHFTEDLALRVGLTMIDAVRQADEVDGA